MDFFSEKEIETLLNLKTENSNLDYKQGFIWNDKSKKDEKLNIIKDILAMANTKDGGKILFGINDDTFDFIGLSNEEFKSFDPTDVNNLLEKYSDPKHICNVFKKKFNEKNIIIFSVPEFNDVPIICKENANSNKNSSRQILKNGQVYIRTKKGSSEIIPSSQEMRELLGRALIKRGDELLHNIECLIKGKPLKTTEEAEKNYNKEIKEANDFLSQNIGNKLKKYGYWEIRAYPADYNSKRIPDQIKIKELIEKSEVHLRGWNFPHTDSHGNASNFSKGRQSYNIWERYMEGYRAYKSGLFVWKRAFWEDIKEFNDEAKFILSFVNAIWSITEFILFFKRYYEKIALESNLHIEIILHKTKDRKLSSLDFDCLLGDYYIAKENSIFIEENFKVINLKTSYKKIANQIVREIFLLFNCNDINETTIDQWQTKLIKRNF